MALLFEIEIWGIAAIESLLNLLWRPKIFLHACPQNQNPDRGTVTVDHKSTPYCKTSHPFAFKFCTALHRSMGYLSYKFPSYGAIKAAPTARNRPHRAIRRSDPYSKTPRPFAFEFCTAPHRAIGHLHYKFSGHEGDRVTPAAKEGSHRAIEWNY